MNLVNDYEKVYEEDLRPIIEESGDPFMSRDLETDISTNVVGRILKQVSQDEDYDLEIVDKWPYVFSEEGRTPYFDDYSEEAKEIGKRCIQILETQDKMDETEIEHVIDHLSNKYQSFNSRQKRKGEVRDILKESIEIDYSLEQSQFTWKG